MADQLYLQILDQIGAETGLEPQSFGLPAGDENLFPPEYTASMNAFSRFLEQDQQTPALPEFPKARPQVGLLQRPQQALSELLLGGDPLEALASGRASTPSLGYALFPGAQEKGFQAADVPAFAVDVLTDPLTYILPPILGKSFKMVGKLFGTQVPVKFFADTANDILQKTSVGARRSALKKLWQPVDKGGLGMTSEWFRELMLGAKMLAPGQQVPKIAQLTAPQIDNLLAHMQTVEYLKYEPASGIMGNLASRLGLFFQPISSVLERQGGVYGTRISKGLDSTMRGTYSNFGRVVNDYLKFVSSEGLDNAAATPIRKASTLITEAGGANATLNDIITIAQKHGNVPTEVMDVLSKPAMFAKARNLAQRQRDLFDNYRNILSGFKDAGGREFMVQTDKGAIPFRQAALSNYAPHMFDWSQLKRGTVGYDKFVTNFMKQNNLTSRAVAEDVIEVMVRKVPKKFANIEHQRLINLGDYELDPLVYVPDWVHKTEYRLNFAKNFGLGGDMHRSNTLSQLMRGAKASGLDARWADDVAEMMLGRHPRNYAVSDLVRKITGFQVLNKMGIGATISNLSQSVNTGTVFGIRNLMRGMADSFTDEGERLGALAYNRATKEAIQEMMTGNPGHGWASQYLDAIGFNWAEKWNRFFAANTGVAALKDWSAQYAVTKAPKLAERMQRLLGVTEAELAQIATSGRPTRYMMDRAALLAAEVTQHATGWHQLPKLWQIPAAKLALQYKNFAYNQTRFMFQQVVGPALQFMNTRGTAGDIAPLLRALPLFTATGHGVSHLRDLIRTGGKGIVTGDWDRQEKWLWEQDDDWLVESMKDTLTVGAFGIMGDMFTAAQRGRLPEWLLGPTVGDLAEFGERSVAFTGKLAEDKQTWEDFDKFATWAGRRLAPAAASLVPKVGMPLAAMVQNYPYDVTYGDVDLDAFPRDMMRLLEEYR